jgi:hypothetical protein
VSCDIEPNAIIALAKHSRGFFMNNFETSAIFAEKADAGIANI